jgi:hypothetical protein
MRTPLLIPVRAGTCCAFMNVGSQGSMCTSRQTEEGKEEEEDEQQQQRLTSA